MTKIRVLHCNSDGEGWTADSPDLDGWSVAAASYKETRVLAEEAVRARLDSDGETPAAADDIEITHHIACSR
jgi:hypothetical protein